MVHLSIRELRDSIEQTREYFSQVKCSKVDSLECDAMLTASAKYRQSLEKPIEEKARFEIPPEMRE